MQLSRLIQIAIVSVFLAISLVAQAVDFPDGEYEIAVSQGIKGLPGGMGSFKWRECLTKERPMPTKYLQAQSCDVLESKTLYRTLHYKMSCFNEHGSYVNEGQLRFSNTKINGKSKSEMGDVDGESVVIRYKFRGRRIGYCQ